uniref:Uncharacterized protein n=1 Tax=Anguilla anguilla TaxID=7936 RepID=A0A0E9RZE6_ANGAN
MGLPLTNTSALPSCLCVTS